MFAATGIAEPGADKADVTARAARWRFSYHSAEGIDQHRLLLAGTRALIRLAEDDAIIPDLDRLTHLVTHATFGALPITQLDD